MKHSILTTLTLGAVISSAQAVTISQVNSVLSSGTGDYGHELRLDSSIFTDASYTLDDVTFYKGNFGGGGSTTLYVDVYMANTGDEFDNNINTGDLSNLTFLGSSTNFIDYTAVTGASTAGVDNALVWNFSGIELVADRDVILVWSSDSGAGNNVGTPMVQTGSNPTDYTNITDLDSDPLFGGNPVTNSQDHTYFINLSSTAVPEPTSTAFIGLAGVGLLLRRRR